MFIKSYDEWSRSLDNPKHHCSKVLGEILHTLYPLTMEGLSLKYYGNIKTLKEATQRKIYDCVESYFTGKDSHNVDSDFINNLSAKMNNIRGLPGLQDKVQDLVNSMYETTETRPPLVQDSDLDELYNNNGGYDHPWQDRSNK